MQKYSYEGPVVSFGRCIEHNWYGSTYAVSEKKARANLEYQYKKQTGRAPNSKVELPGKITLAE
jgi:hypothetical protein